MPHRGQQKAKGQQQKNRLRWLRKTLGEALLKERTDSGLGKSIRSYVETCIAWNRVNDPSQLEELTRTDLPWP
jgi:hypothetical protein